MGSLLLGTFILFRFGVYMWTFGCTLNPSSHPVLYKLGTHQTKYVQDLLLHNASLFYQAISLQIPVNAINHISNRHKTKNIENDISAQKTTNMNNGHIKRDYNLEPSCMTQGHCAMSPDSVRYETECLRTDFNLRMKQILFNSVVSSYYVAFIPIKFTQVCYGLLICLFTHYYAYVYCGHF